MTHLTALKAATSLHDVAHLLGYKPSALAYILYKLGDGSKYAKFDIPKRNGGIRTISAPTAQLKQLQRNLANLLEICIDQLNKDNGRSDQFAHGFKKGRSIFTNAKQHKNQRWVFNLDLENFFGTINFGRVRGYFIKDRGFALNETVATILAQIACFDNALPQGSPCSPIVSNLIAHLLDIHLARLAAKTGCRYSRYADDLTFSTNKRDFPKNIGFIDVTKAGHWVPGGELVRLVDHARFSINEMKTRMQYKDSRQDVTGLVVNKKINVKAEYRRTVRAMVHTLLSHGHFDHVLHSDDGSGKKNLTMVPGTTNELHGMLGFIDSVDRYNRRLLLQTGGKAPDEGKKPIIESQSGKVAQTGKEHLYRRFLLYKEFFACSKPVIICEGATDNVYLVHAIRSLAAGYPTLASIPKPGEIKITPRIFKYVETSTGRILELTGGSADLGRLIRTYDKEIKRFVKPSIQHPLILLIDNDDGALGGGRPFQAAKQITKLNVDRKAPFIHIVSNLYLVPTPLLDGATQSKIEDFFNAATLAEIVDGKSFHSGNDQDSAKNYGKKVFAHRVVRPKADLIDFNGFTTLLDNISFAINDFYKKHPLAPTPVKP
ncbi:MAG TPA: retron Ec67 family RNA-directed DNA polymerase/endonuclease [Burkholderiaceae bacterium]|nr:retron Ec67 family RNA-directed DNA polymerase/endonuclease [Burkholderiaceae bacterium]